jgi:hypothetical protein
VVATIVIRGAGAASDEVVEAAVETQITTEKKPVEKAPEKK